MIRQLLLLLKQPHEIELTTAIVNGRRADETSALRTPAIPKVCSISRNGIIPTLIFTAFLLAPLTAIADNAAVAYHVDPIAGADANDGLSPATAWKSWGRFQEAAQPGSSLLLKRGCVFTLPLPLRGGSPDAPVTYGAYGEGPKPILEGRIINLSRPGAWTEAAAGVWRTTTDILNVANVVFDETVCGNMRYAKEELRNKGEWFQDASGKGPLFLCCPENPERAWKKVELVLDGNGITLKGPGASHIRIEDLAIRKVGTHGIHIRDGATDVVVSRCDLSLIGGAVFRADSFSKKYGQRFVDRRVRFGNGIETWGNASDVTVEGCRIHDIFDGGFCIQGMGGSVANNVQLRNNVFWNCGYDSMDIAHGVLARKVVFENNTCVNAGEGWALQGEPRPRYSVNAPDNIGWHCNLESSFAWDDRSEVSIHHNIFFNAPESRCFNYGPEKVSRSIQVDHNCYFQRNPADAISQVGKNRYTAAEFDSYRKLTGWDEHSLVADPIFVDVAAHDFRLKPGSPCAGMGASLNALDQQK